jgi:hypothetical protein
VVNTSAVSAARRSRSTLSTVIFPTTSRIAAADALRTTAGRSAIR